MSERESERIRFVLECHGFRPIRNSAAFIEFSKMYADEHGRTGRAIVQLERGRLDLMGSLEARLHGFSVEMKTKIGPSESEIMKAPLVMRQDLLHVLHDLSVTLPELPSIVCTACGRKVSTFGAHGFCLECESTHA